MRALAHDMQQRSNTVLAERMSSTQRAVGRVSKRVDPAEFGFGQTDEAGLPML